MIVTKLRLTGLSVLIVAALVIAACGGADPTATSPPAPTATTAGPAPTTVAPTPVPTAGPPTVTPAVFPTAAPLAKYGGTLVRSLPRDETRLDQSLFLTMPVTGNLFNFLVVFHPDQKDLVPDLAESWQLSDDGTVYTFNLKKGVKWHDGKPFTADDAVFSLERIAFSDETKAGRFRNLFSPVDSVEKIDEFTVRITLKNPSGSYLKLLGVSPGVIYPQHNPVANLDKKTSETVIGSGAFTYKEFVAGVKTSLVRNSNYFKKDAVGRALPYLDAVDLVVVPDPNTEYSLFRTGKIDITYPYVPTVLRGKEEQVKRDIPGVQVTTFHGVWLRFVFNANVAPWDDVRVRKAFSLAIDRQEFHQSANRGLGDPYRTMISPGAIFAIPPDEVKAWPGWNPATKAADIAESKRLLAAAGIDPASLTDKIGGGQQMASTGPVIVEVVNNAIGSKMTLDLWERSISSTNERQRNYTVLWDVEAGVIPGDPLGELDPYFRCDTYLNASVICDADVDAQLDAIDRTIDQPKRIQLSRALEEQILLEDVWFVHMGSDPFTQARLPRVRGYQPPIGLQEAPDDILEAVWLDQ